MLKKGQKFYAFTPEGLKIPQIIYTDPETITVTRTRDGVERNYVNTIADCIAKHPETGQMYLRIGEVLNFGASRSTTVVGLDVTEDGDLLVTYDEDTKTFNVDALSEYYAEWRAAHPSTGGLQRQTALDA